MIDTRAASMGMFTNHAISLLSLVHAWHTVVFIIVVNLQIYSHLIDSLWFLHHISPLNTNK